MTRDAAARLVDSLLADLDGRAGFDRNVDDATRAQWREDWIGTVLASPAVVRLWEEEAHANELAEELAAAVYLAEECAAMPLSDVSLGRFRRKLAEHAARRKGDHNG